MEITPRKIRTKLEQYENHLNYLTEWCEQNKELSNKISKWLTEKVDNTDIKNLKIITNYHIEISKIMYSTIALLDKIYRQKERYEKWQSELEKVQ